MPTPAQFSFFTAITASTVGRLIVMRCHSPRFHPTRATQRLCTTQLECYERRSPCCLDISTLLRSPSSPKITTLGDWELLFEPLQRLEMNDQSMEDPKPSSLDRWASIQPLSTLLDSKDKRRARHVFPVYTHVGALGMPPSCSPRTSS
jgi:hypothetical protein